MNAAKAERRKRKTKAGSKLTRDQARAREFFLKGGIRGFNCGVVLGQAETR